MDFLLKKNINLPNTQFFFRKTHDVINLNESKDS
ncbi:hypothetical protein FBY54_1888 [Zymomonas mobilis]|uniref:Uncharacterized protein n=1 Tax=Zymomonas mobilis subsp. mobilis (strain ATCC 10988 / DSM 424 / LMG 404 / NCIMB 8938 / NRRL B-806 / ZM1) TaxID=555217 RepID=A0A0H3G4R1_ZYMMA|nr:conserved hypothetical protein [Zymomonas mobilis subsp. mobilis ATCC 10988]TQL24954.1 hypothetical protein FBY54_1888 [Zymomonas mobilis]